MTREEKLDMMVGQEVEVTIRFSKDVAFDGTALLEKARGGRYTISIGGEKLGFPGKRAYHINVNTPSFWINRKYTAIEWSV